MEPNNEEACGSEASTSPIPLAAPIVQKSSSVHDFLSRVQMSDKFQSILRSPCSAPSGIRQRSVYTSISPISRFNNISPNGSVSQRNGILTATTTGSLSGRQMPSMPAMPSMHMPTVGNNVYDALSMRHGSNIARTYFSTRYPAIVTPSSPIYSYDRDMTRMPQLMNLSHHAHHFPVPLPPPPHAVASNSARSGSDYDGSSSPQSSPGGGLVVMTNGTIQMRLRDGIRIDMTLDKAVRVVNQRCMVAIALSHNCNNSAVVHPNGRVLQNGSKVEIVTYDAMKNNNFVRYAKMWYKGVSFTSDSCALIYLVDSAGTRTTADSFTDMTKDFTLTVLYDQSRHGPSFVPDASDMVQNSSYTCTDEGTEIYDINGFRITQAADGLVKLTRGHNKCLIRTSPSNGSATLTTAGIHCTASLGRTSHLFVRRNEKRMHFDGSCFIVRNAGHSAGFNENNLLIVY